MPWASTPGLIWRKRPHAYSCALRTTLYRFRTSSSPPNEISYSILSSNCAHVIRIVHGGSKLIQWLLLDMIEQLQFFASPSGSDMRYTMAGAKDKTENKNLGAHIRKEGVTVHKKPFFSFAMALIPSQTATNRLPQVSCVHMPTSTCIVSPSLPA